MSERDRLLKSIADTIADYRAGEIEVPTPEHVNQWICQFGRAVQEPILAELDHVLKRTYVSRARAEAFLSAVVRSEKLVGKDPCSFWRGVSFLDIQGGGQSQSDLLIMFEDVLHRECGLRLSECGKDSHTYIYLDDASFSGNRIRHDLTAWLETTAPATATVHIVAIALHQGGEYYATGKIQEVARQSNKKLSLMWWRSLTIEDRKNYTYSADVLRPVSIPDDAATNAYVATLGFEPVLRRPGSLGTNAFFSSEDGRNLLEQELLKAGVRIRSESPLLSKYQRPLGYMVLETLGFGSLLVTFRNCPNNAPLALWAGDPWYPLFPRKTN